MYELERIAKKIKGQNLDDALDKAVKLRDFVINLVGNPNRKVIQFVEKKNLATKVKTKYNLDGYRDSVAKEIKEFIIVIFKYAVKESKVRISKGDSKGALQLLTELSRLINPSYENEIILISNRFNSWVTEERQGLDPPRSELNRINKDLLEISQNIKIKIYEILEYEKLNKEETERRTIAIIATGVFIICFFYGFIQGQSKYSDQEIFERVLFSQAELCSLNDSYYFKLECDNLNYLFNVEEDSLSVIDQMSVSSFSVLKDAIPLTELGGIVSVLGFWEFSSYVVARNYTSSKSRYLIMGIAAISGYSIGYYLGLKDVPTCSDRGFRHFLEEKKNWVKMERQHANRLIYNELLLNNHLELIPEESLRYLDSIESNQSSLVSNFKSIRDSIGVLYEDKAEIYRIFFIDIDLEKSNFVKNEIFQLTGSFRHGAAININLDHIKDSVSVTNLIYRLENAQTLYFKLYERIGDKEYSVNDGDIMLLLDREKSFYVDSLLMNNSSFQSEETFEETFNRLYIK